MRSLPWLALLLIGCSREASVPSASEAPLVSSLGEGGKLVLREGRLHPASAIEVGQGWPAFEVALPLRAHEPLRVALRDRADVSLEIEEVGDASVEGRVEGGRVTFDRVATATHLAMGVKGTALETVRVLASAEASPVWRMKIVAGAGVAAVRAREGRIEAVEASGYVPLASAPLFAIDAAGVTRPMDVRVSRVAGAYEVQATLDTAGLTFPVTLDPLWSSTPAMAASHDQHTATLLSDGRVLVTGGYASNNAIATCEIFDPKTNTWSTAASMVAARAEHTATLLGDGRVFVAFGAGAGTSKPKLNSAEIYDPKTNKWTDVTTTGFQKPVPRVAHTATLIATGEVFLTGGVTGTSPESTTNRQTLYNPATNTWNVPFDPGFASFMKASRAYHAAALVGGKVWALGGESMDTAGTPTTLDSIESWSAATGWVLSTAKLTKARCEHAWTVTTAGLIQMVGGGTRCRGFGSTPIAAGETYNPATDTVGTGAPALSSARSRHTLSVLPSGQMLVTGGVGNTGAGGAYFSTAEIFDGKTWGATSPMSILRNRHTATVLGDGRVLVVGGGSAELFAPTTTGTACTTGTSCASGFCVEGVCCDTACNGNCESCVVAGSIGTCKPVLGAPVGGRPACDSGAGVTCKAKRCDGKSRDCVFVGTDTTCTKASCATGTAVAAATCDGSGNCSTPLSKDCAPYICGVDACRTDCTIDDQCVKGFTCNAGVCSSGAVCQPDGTSKGKDGVITQCAPYKCGGDGLCIKACATSADCVAGNTCDTTTKACVPNAGSTDDAGGCTFVPARAHGEVLSVLVGLGLALTARRSIRRGRPSARRTTDKA